MISPLPPLFPYSAFLTCTLHRPESPHFPLVLRRSPLCSQLTPSVMRTAR